jgi:hypothetical protein
MSISAERDAMRVEEKSDAIAAIEDALATISDAGREPDLWERTLLREAIGYLFRGGYRPAALMADLALTPQDQRSRRPNLKSDPILDRCDIALLVEALEVAKSEPLKDFPQLGPIQFT